MLGIGDEDADVVQDGRMAEQFPRLFVRPDAAALRGGVIQLQGKAQHVPGMAFLVIAAPGQTLHALFPYAAGHGLRAVAQTAQLIHQDAVQDVAVADLHGLQVQLFQHGLQDGRPRHEHFRPPRAHARQFLAPGQGQGADVARGAAQVLQREGGFVRAGSRAPLQTVPQRMQGLDGAGTAHQFRDVVGAHPLEAVRGLHAHEIAHGREFGFGDRLFPALEELVVQPHAAQLEGFEAGVIQRVAHGELGAAAADVHE